MPVHRLPTLVSQGLQRLPLRTVLILPFVVQTLGVLGFVGYTAFKNGQVTVDKLIVQLQNTVVTQVEHRLETYVSTPRQLNRINQDAFELGLIGLTDRGRMEQYFWRQMQTYAVGQIKFGSETGAFVGVNRTEKGFEILSQESAQAQILRIYNSDRQGRRTQVKQVLRGANPLDTSWYTLSKRTGQPTWSYLDQSLGEQRLPTLSSSFPVYGRNRAFLGVLSIDLPLTEIGNFLQTINATPSGRTFILERDGLLVASSGTAQPSQRVGQRANRLRAVDSQDSLVRETAQHLHQQFSDLHRITQPQRLVFSVGTQRQFAQVTPWKDVQGLDWLLVVVVPEAEFVADINASRQTALLLCGVAMVMAVLVGCLTTRWIVRPIRQLNRAAKSISLGDLQARVASDRGDELGELAQSFNQMAQQLQTSFQDMEQANQVLEDRIAQRTAALTTAETELRGLFAAMTEVILVFDRRGRCLKIVATQPNLLSSPVEEQLGKRLHDLYAREQADQFLGHIQDTLRHRQPVQFEYSLVLGGNETWFAASLSPISADSVIWVARDISDRYRAEIALRQSEEHNRAILAALPDLVIRCSRTGRYLDCVVPKGFTRLLHDGEIVGKTLFDVLPAELAQDRLERIQQVLRTGEIHVSEEQVQLGDRRLYSEIRIVPTNDAEVLIVVRDITAQESIRRERKKLQEDLLQSQQFLDSILETMPLALFVKDVRDDLRYVLWNRAAESIYGIPRERAIGHTLYDLVDQSLADQLAAEDQKVIQQDALLIEEESFESPFHGQIWQRVMKQPLRNSQGEPTHLLYIGEDVTERKRIQESLQQSEAEMRALFAAMIDIVLVLDRDGRYMKIAPTSPLNPYKPPETLLGQTLHDVFPSQDADLFLRYIRQTLATQQMLGVEYSVMLGDREVWFATNISPLSNDLVVWIARDITERKQTEEIVQLEKEKSERLLLNILPETIATRLRQSSNTIAENFEEVTILFADIVGFTQLSSQLPPIDLVNLLNDIFSEFDHLTEFYDLEKIKTIGDAYMVVAGLPVPKADHAEAIADMALSMRAVMDYIPSPGAEPIQIRIGINTGMVVAGVIGTKKFIYDLWGDAVNVASRMESHGQPGAIQVTEATYVRLRHKYRFETRGEIAIKGKGSMKTYWLLDKAS